MVSIDIPVFRTKKDCENWSSTKSICASAHIVLDMSGSVHVEKEIQVSCTNVSIFNFEQRVSSLSVIYTELGKFMCVNKDLIFFINAVDNTELGYFWLNNRILSWVEVGDAGIRVTPVVINALYDKDLIMLRNTCPAIQWCDSSGANRIFCSNQIDNYYFWGSFKVRIDEGISHSGALRVLM